MEKVKLGILYSGLRPELDIIENELARTVDSSSHLLNDASLHLLQAGGKRIRPVFVLLCAKFGDSGTAAVRDTAVALELIHMASLVHDDVIDDSLVRRGGPTVKAQWNSRVAMYTGDFMFARALERVSAIDHPVLHEVLAKAIIEVCRGEIIQIEDKQKLDQNLRSYLRRIKRKTALLISSSCELGALAAGTAPDTAARLRRFGYFIGMSFQIIDDVLDFTSSDAELGKPAGSDFLQGNITLPILAARDDAALQRLLADRIGRNLSADERMEVVEAVRQGPGIRRSKELSDRYLKKALDQLEPLPDGRAKKALRDVALFIGKRRF
ncbi:polyprenyl synthetase family protein [Indiicoccus explosivorum]|uniref:polyprenyl synthetase family protein n=1 Tax=Indiicoccus explosivorum TaxID=1917864 RepID=UPI000B44533D|nr:polyprenyl synthetase family protein [Indiicoccus explosivorum]